MIHSNDTRQRFIVTIVVILGAICIVLAVILGAFGQANQIFLAILSVGFLLCSVLAVVLGYNVFARFQDAEGHSGEFKTTVPKDR